MKLIIQTGLVDHQKADAKCCFKLLEQIPDKDQYFIITTGFTDGPICISGIHGYSFKNIKAPRMFRLFFSFFFHPTLMFCYYTKSLNTCQTILYLIRSIVFPVIILHRFWVPVLKKDFQM